MYNPQIETLIQVADAGSFSKAAERLYITPVSVMNQVNALEKRVGVKLFERTNHGVELTEAGRSIYQDAKQIIAASDAAIERARHIAGVERFVIRIGTSILRPCKRLIDLWTKVDDGEQPFQIKIVPFEDDPASMSAMLKSLGSEIDCFISPCDSVAWKKSYSIHPIGTCKCCIAVSRRHRLAKKDRLTWVDMAGETLMLTKRGESPVLDRMRDEIEASHPDIQIVDMPNFYDMEAFNACEQRGCLMEVPDTWAEVHPSVATLPVEWEYEMPFGIAYAQKPSKAFAEFMKIIETSGESM